MVVLKARHRKAITEAMRKVFIEDPSEFDPSKYLKPAMDAMVKLYTARQASKIKKVLSVTGMARRYAEGEFKQKFA